MDVGILQPSCRGRGIHALLHSCASEAPPIHRGREEATRCGNDEGAGGNENRNWLELVVIGDGGFMSRCNGAQVMQPHASDCRRARERER